MKQPTRTPEGYVRLHRSLLEWEWFCDSQTLHVFIYLLLHACFKPIRHAGVSLAPGQLITARRTIARDTGLSEQRVRTALARLQRTREITLSPTREFTLISITNYARYQGLLSPAPPPASGPPPSRRYPEKKNVNPEYPEKKRGAFHDGQPEDHAHEPARYPAAPAEPGLYAGEYI